MRPLHAFALPYLCAAVLLASDIARADAIDECVTAASSGQELQRQGRLRDARARFLECVRPECPSEVKSVCDQLLATADASLPTVIFAARDRLGADLVAVRVLLDGQAVVASLDGKAVTVDPGPHLLRFEHDGTPPIDLRVLVREGEKNRELAVTFEALPPVVARPTSPPVLGYVFGAVGLASMGAFTYLLVHGQHQFDACNPDRCAASTIRTLEVERGLAFGALGVGLTALGLSAWSFLVHAAASRSATPVVGLSIGVGSSGARVITQVSF
jgi:hypothetical protein